uniref:DUF3825 domain-containing protein n=1 Tax=Mesocestoides corti TaxID=53468 RepID=A0A5K3EWE8_MESCO
MDVMDLLPLLEPEVELEESHRYAIHDQLRMNLDVLGWFKVDISEYEKKLEEFPELSKFGKPIFPKDFQHPKLLKNEVTKVYLPQKYLNFVPEGMKTFL